MNTPLRRSDFSEPTLVVSVSRFWHPGSTHPTLEDASRGYWRVGDSARAAACKWLMATYQGRIAGVWLIDRTKGFMQPSQTPKKSWPEDRGNDLPTRRGCELLPAPKWMHAKFMGMPISDVIRQSFPYAYIGV